ncbi:MAG: hypothetical protein ACP5I4_14065 [Oceanipulchritudo sp.]
MPQERREPMLVRISMLLLLLNVSLCVGLRSVDILLVSLAATFVALGGAILAQRGLRLVRRRSRGGGSESMGLMAYWGNLVLFILAALLFCYSFAMGVLRGELL